MNITNFKINQHEGYANLPSLVLTVDKIPDDDSFRYIEKKSGDNTLYFAECNDVVKFLCHNPTHERGYGGSVFNITMQDGSARAVKGPWSSRSGSMNHYFTHSIECVIIDESTGYRLAMAITTKLADTLLATIGARLEMIERRQDVVYEIHQ